MVPSEDDLTYAHCLNAALISHVFGGWLSLSPEDIKILTLCGFVYDIGKITLPNSLIWSPGKLSDFQYNWMKTNTTIGYQLMKNQKFNQHIIHATLMHHERCDGSGYPNHLKDDDIDIFAKYISIVDAYAAMTSARIYRKSKNAFEVIDSFLDAGVEKYGAGIIWPILEHIANAQLGRKVLLSNDMNADVILINKRMLSRPLVKVEEEVLDLSKTPELKIISIL
jgi:HD-GYP domain-containing protein (c-di-GMP phosphodiesterase class II)